MYYNSKRKIECWVSLSCIIICPIKNRKCNILLILFNSLNFVSHVQTTFQLKHLISFWVSIYMRNLIFKNFCLYFSKKLPIAWEITHIFIYIGVCIHIDWVHLLCVYLIIHLLNCDKNKSNTLISFNYYYFRIFVRSKIIKHC